MPTYFIAGGAGFIGSHLTQCLLQDEPDASVVVFDNFTSGTPRHLEKVKHHPRLKIIQGDLKNTASLLSAMSGCSVVYHFASNPDIAKAITQPDIDFWEGTYLTNNLLEAMRQTGASKLLYASGSGIYGDPGLSPVAEDYALKYPISTYGASKLAGEALLSSYCFMFGLQGVALRFANVVGPQQTHGVGYDFIRKLRSNPKELEIFGDGTQNKSYIYVDDVIAALRLLEKRAPAGFSYYNVATEDAISVNEIADQVVDILRLAPPLRCYTGGDRGWKGDVPKIRMDSEKIRSLGWKNRYTSAQAIRASVAAMAAEVQKA